jgi:2',3'-cyclic-nucleotide 2'-phosphodiesterase (5'-nucleotidase family)
MSMAALAVLLSVESHAAKAELREPDRLVILSTTDMKGKTSPCGCHVPKGGFSRQASFIDSLRAGYDQILIVDNGGFFPEQGDDRDLPRFMMEMMKRLDVQAVGVGERDLRLGASYLKAEGKRAGVPLVCANLVDKRTRKPFLTPHLIAKVGSVKVGVFAVLNQDANLGPSRDSLAVTEPAVAAREAVKALRSRGAEVVVLLSQLGKVASEDLVVTVEGIDAVVPGHNVPILQKGRMIGTTTACYGGEQGQYLCKTVLSLDERRRATTGEATAVMLGPEISDHAEVLQAVKAFEAEAAERARKQNPAGATAGTATTAVSDTLHRH